jgi:hypothetical protein
MVTEREMLDKLHGHLVGDYESVVTRGPFTTLYWDSKKNDNVPQQQLTVTIGEQTFEILVREKK